MALGGYAPVLSRLGYALDAMGGILQRAFAKPAARPGSIGGVIPRDHVHEFRPFYVRDLPNGHREIQSRCQCEPNTEHQHGTMFEQKLVYDPHTGRPVSLRFRFGGLWFNPLDLARLAPPVEECPTCGGDPNPVYGAAPCATCGGIGVTVAGSVVTPPAVTLATA